MPRQSPALLIRLSPLVALALALPLQEGGAPGYRDTPMLPGDEWHVHDSQRPTPEGVQPKGCGEAPSDAVVLFDGKNLSAWRSDDGPANWKVQDGAMIAGGGTLTTRGSFGDCQLHLEWATPASPKGEGQARGNSGVFLMGMYEVQVLDSYGNATYADGQAAALYGQYPPLANASRPPGEWQSYDIVFRAPRFEGERLLEPARVTVLHNGVVAHHARELLGATRHRELAQYAPHAPALPLSLQDHGDPVRFRNIWIRPLQLP